MNKQYKIRRAARHIANGYILTIQEGRVPAYLSSIVQESKYDILDSVNDRRLNMIDTIEAVRREAHYMIKERLTSNPDLAKRLVDGRAKIEAEQAAIEREEECKANAPLARFLSKLKSAKQ